MYRTSMLLLLFATIVTLPAQGGIFGKKVRPPRQENGIRDLLQTAKSDPDEGKRTAAIGELRDLDAQANPDIIPTLIDLLQNDTRPGVRREAASALARVRPGTAAAGQALQNAASKDPSLRVRMQAWSSYKLFQLGGNSRPAPKDNQPSAKQPTTDEPPLIDPDLVIGGPPTARTGPSTVSPAPGPIAPRRFTPPPSREEGPIIAPPK